MRKKIRILAYLLLLSLSTSAFASPGRILVRAKLDSTILMMGKITHIDLTVQQDKNVKGQFDLFSHIKQNGIIPVCGDSVELRAPVKTDTVLDGNLMVINLRVPVQSFDSGYYQLPEFIYISGNDTARSNKLALKVVPVNVSANDPIDDYANVSDPENSSIFDSVPDWVLNYWWIILLAIIALAVALYAFRKYRRDGSLLGKKPQPTPYEVAISALRDLKEKKLWEQGMEKEYFTELIDILRTYLFGRFGINAMEMTSRQILASLSRNEECKDKRDYIRQILIMADFVKFAKVRPLPDDNIAAYDNALKFVKETKPVPVLDENGNPVDPQNSLNNKTASKKAVGKKTKRVSKNRKGGLS